MFGVKLKSKGQIETAGIQSLVEDLILQETFRSWNSGSHIADLRVCTLSMCTGQVILYATLVIAPCPHLAVEAGFAVCLCVGGPSKHYYLCPWFTAVVVGLRGHSLVRPQSIPGRRTNRSVNSRHISERCGAYARFSLTEVVVVFRTNLVYYL